MSEFYGNIVFPQGSGAIFANGPIEFKDDTLEIPVPISQPGQPRLDTENDSIVGGINEVRALLVILQGQVNVSGLEDVDITTIPNDGDIIAFNAVDSIWESSGVVKSINGFQGAVTLGLGGLDSVSPSLGNDGDALIYDAVDDSWAPSGIVKSFNGQTGDITFTGGGGGSGSSVDERQVSGSIIPSVDSEYALGAPGSRFSHIYSNSGVFSTSATSPTDSNIIAITTDSNLTTGFPLYISTEADTHSPGVYVQADNSRGYGFFGNSSNTKPAMELYQDNLAYAENMIILRTTRAQSSSFFLLRGDNINGGQIVFTVRGDGQIASDVAGVTTPADYAEYFESIDPSGIPVGFAVEVTASGYVQKAISPDDFIGFVSANPAFVADGGWNSWQGKYVLDDFDARVLNDMGEPIISDAWVSGLEYVPREDRPEWVVVGLLGKLSVRTCETISSNWATLGASGMVKNWTNEDLKWKVLERKQDFDETKGYGVVRLLLK